jgi:hypothetical protein
MRTLPPTIRPAAHGVRAAGRGAGSVVPRTLDHATRGAGVRRDCCAAVACQRTSPARGAAQPAGPAASRLAVALCLTLVMLPGCRHAGTSGVAEPGALQVSRYRVTEAQTVGMAYIMAEVTNPAREPVPAATITAVLRGAAGESVGTGSRPLPRLNPGESCVSSFAIATHGKHKDVEFTFSDAARRERP